MPAQGTKNYYSVVETRDGFFVLKVSAQNSGEADKIAKEYCQANGCDVFGTFPEPMYKERSTFIIASINCGATKKEVIEPATSVDEALEGLKKKNEGCEVRKKRVVRMSFVEYGIATLYQSEWYLDVEEAIMNALRDASKVVDLTMTNGVDMLKEKGFMELGTSVVAIKLGGKCYIINEEALHDLQNGFTEKWSDLVKLLTEHGVIVPSEDDTYIVPWRLLSKCTEWK